MSIRLLTGDCRELLLALEENSVDSIVCDPPYDLTAGKKGGTGMASRNLNHPRGRSRIGTGFMGKSWDATGVAFDARTWAAVLRVLKPGGHLLAFGGTRTYHRMVCAIEDAGFLIQDQIMWVYGTGYPKSFDYAGMRDKNKVRIVRPEFVGHAQAEGWGTALKPAWEPIVVAYKPLEGTYAENVLAYGTGGLNIDDCRVGHVTVDGGSLATNPHLRTHINGGNGGKIIAHEDKRRVVTPSMIGRWPANLIHDGSDDVLAAFPDAPGQLADISGTAPSAKTSTVYGAMKRQGELSQDDENLGALGFKMKPGARRLDSGTAARFFYCAKASAADRGDFNTHPTVKPIDLMRYLVRLVTPPGGAVLDPFMGSGSTGKAAELEGFDFIGMELDPAYIEIARRRIGADAPLLVSVVTA